MNLWMTPCDFHELTAEATLKGFLNVYTSREWLREACGRCPWQRSQKGCPWGGVNGEGKPIEVDVAPRRAEHGPVEGA